MTNYRMMNGAVYDCTAKSSTLESFVNELMLQKRIEFWGEGIVMYDMKRLNANDDPADDITVTREFYPYTTSSVLGWRACHNLHAQPGSRHYALPLPTVDIDRSRENSNRTPLIRTK